MSTILIIYSCNFVDNLYTRYVPYLRVFLVSEDSLPDPKGPLCTSPEGSGVSTELRSWLVYLRMLIRDKRTLSTSLETRILVV